MIKIAIIGAGVSGLTTAWYLRKKFSKDEAWIKIYDKSSKVGGNADTMNIFLKDQTPGWIDMGVNDFNKLTYKNMVALWTELKIMTDEYCKPLINEESFWKGGTSNYKYWVDDNAKVHAEGSEAKDDAQIIEDELEHFKEELAIWYRSGVKNPRTTVGEWVKGRFNQKFIDNNLYPRINGMYYAQEYSQTNVPPPSLMPLWMVAHYYILQEGYGHDNAAVANARQYFVDGSTKWLKFLRDRLREKNVDVDSGMSKQNLNVQKDIRSGGLAVVNGSVLQDMVDIVIFATHAEDTQKLIQFNSTDPDDIQMISELANFNYGEAQLPAVAYAHQDASLLPGDPWSRTYNIHIYDYSQGINRWPYTITYFENMHQGTPQPVTGTRFYTTLNSYQGVPKDVARNQEGGTPARAEFRHCKLDLDAMFAQKNINLIQIEKSATKPRSFYFAGSFTIGAGLHEECIIQAQAIANKIANPAGLFADHIYNFEKGAKDFAPKYIMDAISRKEK